MKHKFANLGEKGEKVFLYDKNKKKSRQVLWGDWLQLDENDNNADFDDEWLAVKWAPKSNNPKTLYIPKKHTTDQRPMEIIFLDVGQGDGAILITPDRNEEEKIIIIDAGKGNNMQTFIYSRFRAYRGFKFNAAIITHPDNDHYGGFDPIFSNHKIGFKTIYQNGLVERPVSGSFAKIGSMIDDPVTGIKYFTDLAVSRNFIDQNFGNHVNIGNFEFPALMNKALNNTNIDEFKMLSTSHGTKENGKIYMEGFAPSDGKDYQIEILGPVSEPDGQGNPRLRRISSNYAETKNGHSIILRVHYNEIKILLGGDLNVPAEKFLLMHYTNSDKFPLKYSKKYYQMIEKASETFSADVMKVCHHGSEKVTDAFLKAVDPACFIISSGDSEGHVHPRPDLLGRLGKLGRGDSPVLLSTELQRSTREKEDQNDIDSLISKIINSKKAFTNNQKADIIEKINKLSKSNVEVYGSIYVKTDGKRLITAFKIESASDTKKWFYFEYGFNEYGELCLC